MIYLLFSFYFSYFTFAESKSCQQILAKAKRQGIELTPFKTDGCTWAPDKVPGTEYTWRQCCIAHDIKYWYGGDSVEIRPIADEDLKQCIHRYNPLFTFKIVGETFKKAVRLFGRPGDKAYSWGFGWKKKSTANESSASKLSHQQIEVLKCQIPTIVEGIDEFKETLNRQERSHIVVNVLSLWQGIHKELGYQVKDAETVALNRQLIQFLNQSEWTKNNVGSKKVAPLPNKTGQ